MKVSLKGHVKKSLESKVEGIYMLQLGVVNGNPNWSQENGTYSIWWFPGEHHKWCIGFTEKIGNSNCVLRAEDDVVGPQEARNWIYFNNQSEGIRIGIKTTDVAIGNFEF